MILTKSGKKLVEVIEKALLRKLNALIANKTVTFGKSP
jgi:hypothetical protein